MLFLINWWPISFCEASFNQFYAPHARSPIPLGYGYGTSPKNSSTGVVLKDRDGGRSENLGHGGWDEGGALCFEWAFTRTFPRNQDATVK